MNMLQQRGLPTEQSTMQSAWQRLKNSVTCLPVLAAEPGGPRTSQSVQSTWGRQPGGQPYQAQYRRENWNDCMEERRYHCGRATRTDATSCEVGYGARLAQRCLVYRKADPGLFGTACCVTRASTEGVVVACTSPAPWYPG